MDEPTYGEPVMSTPANEAVSNVEEYFENQPTGVEAEPDDAPIITEPWNPDLIRVGSKTFSIRHILDLIDEDSLDLAPDFQRLLVWKPVQKSRLVESVLLQIPLPAFYFTEEPDGMMRVVDGLQRLSTLHQYVRGDSGAGGFGLVGLEYLTDVEGARFPNLAPAWQRRIYNTQIVAHVIDPQTPDSVKFDIFKRINTGGAPLNAQEIRHCMSGPQSRQFLKEAVSTQEFQQATAGALRNHIRMVDREVALRFFAFRMYDLADYRQFATMDAFLTAATRRIDQLSKPEQAGLMRTFKRSMTNAYRLFGAHAFRKWPLRDDDRSSPINRALFESWAVALAEPPWSRLAPHKEAIVDAVRTAMTSDTEYIASISATTGDPRRVELRFQTAYDILAMVGR